MALSLYDVTAPNMLQVIAAMRVVLDKGLEHAKVQGFDPDTLVEARIIEDMFPLRVQLQRVADHSAGALRDVAKGAFSMPEKPMYDYAGLQRLMAETEAAVKGWAREDVNGLEGRDFIFDTGSSRTAYTAEAFLFSFSLPNLYFHAVTAYDILRMKGVPIGKRDYLSQMRTKFG